MKFKPKYPALVLAVRGFQIVCALLLCTLTILLYTENADFQAKIAYLHAVRDLASTGSAVLLLAAIGTFILQDRS